MKDYQTDADCKFQLDTRAPALVVQKAGFRGEFVRTPQVTDVRITLQRLSQKFPTCPTTGKYWAIGAYGASFQFPRTSDFKVRRGADIDYETRPYYVDTKRGPKGILHGGGPLWSFGPPVDQDVWRSVKYEETTYDIGGPTIIDARGELPSGDRWRSLGKFGETASYSDVD